MCGHVALSNIIPLC